MIVKFLMTTAWSAFVLLFLPDAGRVRQLPPPPQPPAEFVSIGQTAFTWYDATTLQFQSAGSAGGAAGSEYRVYAYLITDEGLWTNMICWQTPVGQDSNYYWFGGAGYAGGTVTFSFNSLSSANGYFGASARYDGGCWQVYQLQKKSGANWTTVKEAVTWSPLGPPPP